MKKRKSEYCENEYIKKQKSENVKMSKEKSYNQQNNSTTYLQM